jgi:hypothetical protein
MHPENEETGSGIAERVIGRGILTFELFDADGNLVDSREEENLIVTAGFGHITNRMVGTSSGVMSHMAVGTGATAAAAGDTTLQTELARVALDSITRVTTTLTNDTVQHVATFPAGTGTGAITEAGILNASSSGTLQNRVVFSVINKGASDSLVITWKIIFA